MGRKSSAFSSLMSAGALALSLVFTAAAEEPFSSEAPRQIPSQVKSMLVSPDDIAKAKPERVLVGTSLVFVIDVSGSIDEQEALQMTDGISGALRDEVGIDYTECYALTAVYYAEKATTGKTHIVCGPKTMERFIAQEIRVNTDIMNELIYGTSTYIEAGLREADMIFSLEREEMNIFAQHRRIVFVGDGPSKDGPVLKSALISLAERFGVTSYAIPIDDLGGELTFDARKYYQSYLVTPKGLTYVDKEVFGDSTLKVRPGYFLPAPSFSEVRQSVILALQGTGL